MVTHTKIIDGVLLITLDSPPVNALGSDVRTAIMRALDLIDKDDAIIAAVATGAGHTFCGGADIREFGKPPTEPYLPDVLLRLERARIPIVAAINGAAMGGGLETALACRYRIAGPRALMALPEVKLGLIPGAGGTQRLPRLVGVKHAADIITSGRKVNAVEALSMGMIDEVIDGDLLAHAISFAKSATRKDDRASLAEIEKPADWDKEWLDAFEKKLSGKIRGQLSPLKAFEAVRASGEIAFAQGLARERLIFAECMKSDQRKGLIHAFFAERAAQKAPVLEGTPPRDVKIIGILGAGTMGAGIAIACAASGYSVKLFDTNDDALRAGLDRIGKTFDASVAKMRMSADAAAVATAHVSPVISMEQLDDADLVIEAVIERMDAKKAVFQSLEKIVKPGAVLASNTSYLNLDKIASVTSRPEDVIGMHFFSPANIMRLLEVVKTERAAPDALATAMAVGKKLGKVSVLAGVCDGFIGNRIFKKYRLQAEYLIEDGAFPQDVDRVMRRFGFAMGPFQVSDLAGLDIGWHNRRREDATRDPSERYVAIADRLYDMKRLGQKTGSGWYCYDEGGRTGMPDPIVEDIILTTAKKKGVSRRTISDDEILERILFAMINEGAKVLEEGIAQRALDIDTVFINGYAFPAYHGGPMFYADKIGLEVVLDGVRRFAKSDEYAWRPSALLVRLVEEGAGFSSYSVQARSSAQQPAV
jgi:3-hydroxyacyl-CoA dehydrogenase